LPRDRFGGTLKAKGVPWHAFDIFMLFHKETAWIIQKNLGVVA
jgi:hypothetical protein